MLNTAGVLICSQLCPSFDMPVSALDMRAALGPDMVEKAPAVLAVVTGVFLCFWGRRALKPALGLFGALVGGYAAAAGGAHLWPGNQAAALFCGLLGAVLGGVLMIIAYMLGVFVIGATLGGLIGAGAAIHAGVHLRLVVVALLAALGGMLALFLEKYVIITAAALNGAALVVGGLWMLAAGLTPVEAYQRYLAVGPEGGRELGGTAALLIAAWIVLGCLGIWIQVSFDEERATNS